MKWLIATVLSANVLALFAAWQNRVAVTAEIDVPARQVSLVREEQSRAPEFLWVTPVHCYGLEPPPPPTVRRRLEFIAFESRPEGLCILAHADNATELRQKYPDPRRYVVTQSGGHSILIPRELRQQAASASAFTLRFGTRYEPWLAAVR